MSLHNTTTSLNILKIYPASFPLSKDQHTSIVTVSLPYVVKSRHNFTVVSSYTNQPLALNNIIYLPRSLCFESASDKKIIQNIDPRINHEKYQNAVIDLIKLHKPDLVEVEFDIKLAAKLSKIIINIPINFINHINVIRSHNLQWLKNRMKSFFMYKDFKSINNFVFVSKQMRLDFQGYYPWLKDRCYTIHNSFDYITQWFNNEDIRKTEQKTQTIAFIGRALIKKGLHIYLSAIKQFLEHNKDWDALIIGSLETQKEINLFDKLISNYQDLQDNKRLKIYKNISPKQGFSLLQKSKIVALPTVPKMHKEGIPLAGIEAIMSQCLLLSSTSGGFPELNPFEDTFLVNLSTQELYEKLNLFAQSSNKLYNLQQQQYKFLIENFNIEKLITKFDILREEGVAKWRIRTKSQ